jgi:ATP-dependent RNA helicase DOB1
MDSDELFENFNISSYDTSTKNDDTKQFLSKKRNIEHEQNKNSNSENNQKNDLSIIDKYNTNFSKEKKEDLLLSKEIQSIKDSIRTENDNSISKEDTEEINFKINNIPDKEVKIITTKFEGGFHELIFPINIPPPENTIKEISTPATTYPFKLDQFQEKSILCLENHQSVLVSAHTSAGKTVVAQYAIAMSLRDHQRVIYTSPIKALSNQKYRELCEQFNDVGLMTGDVTINVNASCLVMTTEILRNMLYKGSEMIKEIAWVIFDEVHYMRDKVRGVVWEETMILLSNKINYVFLSATIPNAREFAMWISLMKNQPCNVIYTEFRPVPLQHYVYPSSSDDIILVVDEKGNFKEDNFNKALTQISVRSTDENNYNKNTLAQINDKSLNSKEKKLKTEEEDIKAIVDLVIENDLDPGIIFCFSKEKCESLAKSLQNSGINLTKEEEKKTIEEIYICAMLTLSEEDQNIPQLKNMLNILKLGIGIHHGGMVPIIRECVELIFQSGLIKILFSTETFSMGLNMPAKTVVFTEIEKFDGNKNRYLTGGEYIQMSGRAGRRGLDEKGVVIVVLKKKIDPEECREIMRGKSDPLNSSFGLNYNQILNLSRIEGIKCEFILQRSFRQYQSVRAIPLLKKKILRMYNDYLKFGNNWERDELINEAIYKIENKNDLIEKNRLMLFGENSDLRKKLKPYLIKGRFVFIKYFGIGIFVDYCKIGNDKFAYYNEDKKAYEIITEREKTKNNNDNKNNIIEIENKLIDFKTIYLLIYVTKNSSNILIPDNILNSKGKLIKIPFKINSLENISHIKISLPENITESSLKQIEKIYKQISSSLIPNKGKKEKINYKIMEPIKDLKISDKKYIENNNKIEKLNSELKEIEKTFLNTFGKIINFSDNLENILSKNEFILSYKKKLILRNEIKYSINELNSLNRLVLNEELIIMKKVLTRLNYLDKNNLVTFKGQVACCISSGDTIILTEIIFNGFLNNMNENDIGVILSCFVGGEGAIFKKDKQIVEEDKHLMKLYNELKKEIEAVVDIYIEYKINIKDKEKYIKMFRYDFMKNILYWINNEKTFGEICDEKNSEIYGGSMVRCIRRLDELLKELILCADMIGNNQLKEKFENISKKIRRGIPFSASLYLSNENQ